MRLNIKIPILDIFFLSDQRIAFIVNSEDFVPPIKFEANLFLDDGFIGKFEFFKDIISSLRYNNKESFSVFEKIPLDLGMNYSKRKIEIMFIQELDYRPERYSPKSICASLGVFNTLKYLRESQQSSLKLDNEVIHYIEEKCYPELYRKTKLLFIKFEEKLNEKLALSKPNTNVILIFKVDFCGVEVEAYIAEQDILTKIAKYSNHDLSNSIGHMHGHIDDFVGSKSSNVTVGVMIFLLFDVLSSLKSNIKVNNIDISVILDNKISISLGKYYEGNFYKQVEIIDSIKLIRIGPLYSYIRQNYSRILCDHEGQDLDSIGEAFALKLCKKYRAEIFVNVCSDCGYVKRTPRANLCLNCGLFLRPLKKYFF